VWHPNGMERVIASQDGLNRLQRLANRRS